MGLLETHRRANGTRAPPCHAVARANRRTADRGNIRAAALRDVNNIQISRRLSRRPRRRRCRCAARGRPCRKQAASVGIENDAARRAQHGVGGRGVPFHCRRETGIDVALAFGDDAKFERRACASRSPIGSRFRKDSVCGVAHASGSPARSDSGARGGSGFAATCPLSGNPAQEAFRRRRPRRPRSITGRSPAHRLPRRSARRPRSAPR